MITVTNKKLKKSKTVGLHQITDITGLYLFENSAAEEKLQSLQALQLLQFQLKMVLTGSWSVVRGAHIQAFTFRLKITVGCLTSTYPSIHVETPSRSRSVVDCARVQAFTFLLTKTLSRSRSVVWCVVWCVLVVCCGGVVVVLWLCCVWCVVKLGTLSLSCSLSFLFSFPFFFSLLFLFFSSCSFSYSCSCSCSFSFSSFFFLPFYSLFSPLPFTPTNCTKHWSTNTASNFEAFECDLAHGTFIATANELHFPPLLLPPLLSSLLSPSHTQKREGLFITGIFPARELFKITVFNYFHKIAAGWNYRHYCYILIRKQSNCNASKLQSFPPRW